jgi:hypothetical protein
VAPAAPWRPTVTRIASTIRCALSLSSLRSLPVLVSIDAAM